jgi:TolA-binding protein
MKALFGSLLALGCAALVLGERPDKTPIRSAAPVAPVSTVSYQPALQGFADEVAASDAIVQANHQARQFEQLQREVRQLESRLEIGY